MLWKENSCYTMIKRTVHQETWIALKLHIPHKWPQNVQSKSLLHLDNKIHNISWGAFLAWTSLVVQALKNLPAMKDTWVRSLGQKDPLEKGTATHSNVLAWGIPWVEGLAGYSPWPCRVGYDWVTNTYTFSIILILCGRPQ